MLSYHAYTDKPECLYQPPLKDVPQKAQGVELARRMLAKPLMPECYEEVHCEA